MDDQLYPEATWPEMELAAVAAGIQRQLPARAQLTFEELLNCARAAIVAIDVVRDQFLEQNEGETK